MSATPFFMSLPRIETAVTATVSFRDGTNTTRLFDSNPINGSKIESISCIDTTPANQGIGPTRLFLFMGDRNGSNLFLIRENGTVNNNFAYTANIGDGFTFNFTNGLYLGTNSSIFVGQSAYSYAYHWTAYGADL